MSESDTSGTLAGSRIEVVHVPGFEEEILAVAKAGHSEVKDREEVLTRTKEQNEHLERVDRTLEEENKEMSERAKEICA